MMKNGSENLKNLQEILDDVDSGNMNDMINTLREVIILLEKEVMSAHHKINEVIISCNNNTSFFMELFENLGVDFKDSSIPQIKKEKLN